MAGMNVNSRHIYVVGPRRLQNELMVCKIFCQTGMKCHCCQQLEEVPVQVGSTPSTYRLVLYDFQATEFEDLLKTLHTLKRQLDPGFTFALYNLKKGTGFEPRALELGVKGFFYEDDSVDTLTKGVTNIFDGDVWVSRKQMVECLLLGSTLKPPKKRPHSLTHREEEVLSLVIEGETNEQIAQKLCVSHHTVRTHIYNIFKKIQVSNRLQASRWASEHLDSAPH